MSSQSGPSPFNRPAPCPQQSSPSQNSSASSLFPSSSSLSSLYQRPAMPAESSTSVASRYPQATSASSSAAPLPSPTVQRNETQYFTSLGPQSGQNQAQVQQQQSLQPANGFSYKPNREGAGATAQQTSSLLQDYSLVAEAAKRAQMAVLMRDMEGVEL